MMIFSPFLCFRAVLARVREKILHQTWGTKRLLHYAPEFEKAMVESCIKLIKYWFDVGMEEQERVSVVESRTSARSGS